jgi:hypothetical protein
MGYGGALGSGKQVISWIDLDDVTNMYLYALESSLEGVFNAVAPNPVSNETLSRLIANRFSKKPFINVPALALKLVVGEMATTLLESQNVSCKKIQESGFKFSFEKAENSIEKNVASLNSFEKKLDFEQWVPLPPTELFPFFAEAKNLEAITPEFLNFKIVSQSTESIAEGTIIKYKLSLNGLPMGWTTKITQWSPPHMFEDNQESGPYKKWLHKHTFEAFAGGTLMKDSVRLQIPFSALGYFMTSWKVLSDVEKIFKHRRDVIYSKYYADNKNLNKVY